MNECIPYELIQICDYLRQSNLMLSSDFDDGRINASINEKEVIKIILRQFDICVPKSRAWFDFAIQTPSSFLPINIKVTDTSHADNLNCKLGIYYTLTGLQPSFPNEVGWLQYFQSLHANIGHFKDKDYYFLIVNKRNYNDIFANKLTGLQTLVPNGNNLPFQCCWSNNRYILTRTHEQAKQMILRTLGDSLRLRSTCYTDFKRFFPEYA